MSHWDSGENNRQAACEDTLLGETLREAAPLRWLTATVITLIRGCTFWDGVIRRKMLH